MAVGEHEEATEEQLRGALQLTFSGAPEGCIMVNQSGKPKGHIAVNL